MINVEREKVKDYGMGPTVLAEFTVLTTSLKKQLVKMGISEEKASLLMTKSFMSGMTAEAIFEPVEEGEEDE